VPEPAEIDPLVFELDDRGDLGKPVDPLDERVLDRLAEAPGEGEEPRRRQALAAEEDDEVVEPGAADCGDRVVVDLARQIDARDLRADRPGEGMDFRRIPSHASRTSGAMPPARPPIGVSGGVF
jgi:hypothetical protein